MKFTRTTAIALAAVVALSLGAGSVGRADASAPFEVGDLIAGQNEIIGHVKAVYNCATDELTVTYTVDEAGWGMTKTHLYVGATAPEQHAPGQFPYQHEGLADVQSDSYTIDLDGLDPACIYIAAHADARCEDSTGIADIDDFCASLPTGTVDLMATRGPTWSGNSYMGVSLANAGEYSGAYDGWCIDPFSGIDLDSPYAARMICTYSAAFAASGLVENPQNIDQVNYILNQDYVGEASVSDGNFTYGDVQRAIWELLYDAKSTSGLGPWSPARAAEILADAAANGVGYTPECDDVVGVALNLVDSSGSKIAQPLLIGIPLSCTPVYCDETAWAYGNSEFPKGWGWYHKYSFSCP